MGIVAAGALFSFLTFSTFCLITEDLTSFDRAASMFALGNLISVSIGGIIAMVVGFFSLIFVYLFNLSLGNPLSHHTATLTAGSLACFVPTAVLFPADEWWVCLLPPIAAAMGAYGASWSARGHKPDAWRPQVKETKYKLSILRLMIATVWIAVFLAAANLFESKEFVIAVAVWFICNGLLMFLAKLYRHFRPASNQ